MRIELDLPDYINERGIHILAGIEEVARCVPPDFNWEIKAKRCSMCGKCCKDCKDLVAEGNHYRCDLGMDRSYICCIGEGEPEFCSIRWKTIK